MEFVTPNTIRNVNKLLRSCFNQAMRWDLIEKNPAIHATLPKGEHEKREIWTAETLFHAIEVCEDPRLKLAMNLTFQRLIKEHDLPRVVFHSLRHSSITYKLKLNGGDIKAVQGDSGHAQAKMVTDQYAHILDDDRKVNAQLFEKAFYQGQTLSLKTADHKAEEISDDQAALFAKLMKDPETAVLLQALQAFWMLSNGHRIQTRILAPKR